jgi:DEAD/DEAH box helicase domain-containing protein
VILTNPDMLHVGVLPHHDRWGDVLANLRYVVVDEAHVYRGVFGSHVANVLRAPAAARPRLRLGAAVRARLGDDREPGAAGRVAARRAGDRDRQRRAPATERTIALWNPELIDAELGVRASALGDASRLLASSSRAACGRSASRRAARRSS